MTVDHDSVHAIIKVSSDGSKALIEACNCNISLVEGIEKGLKPNNMSREDWVQAQDSGEILLGVITL